MEKKSKNLINAKALVGNVAFFKTLRDEEKVLLAASMEKIDYPSGALIVKEGELIGDVYFIAQGSLTVIKKDEKKQDIHLATLKTGDTIGISDMGFYSETGLRTATVKTLSTCVLFRLTLEKLLEFLQAYPKINPKMHETANAMLHARFIKQSTLFSALSDEATNTLAHTIEIISIPPNTIVLQEGEISDKCYLIRSGELEVSATTDEKERILCHLKSPELFGETSLLTGSPRNATVRSTTACELLVLNRDQFITALKQKSAIAEELSSVVIARSRPIKNPYVSIHYQQTADGEMVAILKNPQTELYYRLSRVGAYIWQLFDGKNTLNEITTSVFDNFFILSSKAVFELVSDLLSQDFVKIHLGENLHLASGAEKLSWGKKLFIRITNIMEAQYSLKNVDNLVTKIYRHGGYLFFTIPAQIVFLLLVIIGAVAFVHMIPAALMAVKSVTLLPILIMLTLLNSMTVIMHEMAHALTTKFFGYEVHRFGIGLYWIGGIAFTDTSDMWLSTRWPRTVVNVAGLYANLVIAGIASIATLFVTTPSILLLLWLLAFSQYMMVFANLDPTLEFDGYYMMMDLLEKPNLREDAVKWLMLMTPKNWRHVANFKQHKNEVLYWGICIIFLIISVMITIFLQKHVTQVFFPHLRSSTWYNYFSYVGIPLLVMLFASLGIWAEMGRQRAAKKFSL